MLGPLSAGPVEPLWISLLLCNESRVIQDLSDHSYLIRNEFLLKAIILATENLQEHVNVMIQFR